ncbi:MAG: hypothetical protein JWO36_5496 [Myxococcales bacterium]|nr:hypothetical protein [Myxococcales bacterium]
MTRLIPIARILLGLVFVALSLNYFIPYLPQPSPNSMSADALAFAGVFITSHFMTFIKVIELASGLALLANRFTALALTLLAPIIVGIILFHVLLAPSELPLAAIVLALEVYLAWAYRGAFAPMLQARVSPRLATTAAPAPLLTRA